MAVLSYIYVKAERADLEMPNSFAPGTLGYRGRPPVAMIKNLEVTSFTSLFLSVHCTTHSRHYYTRNGQKCQKTALSAN